MMRVLLLYDTYCYCSMISVSPRQNNSSKQVLGYTAAVSITIRRRLMFRFFHNTVHVCTRSLACSALLHVPCTSSRCAHELEAKETALRDTPSPNGYRRCTYPESIYPVDRVRARCAIRARLLEARLQEAVRRDGSARLPAPAEQKLHISHLTSSTYQYMHISPRKNYNELRT